MGEHLIKKYLIYGQMMSPQCVGRKAHIESRKHCSSQKRPPSPTSGQHCPLRPRAHWASGMEHLPPRDTTLGALTWLDGLPVGEGQRCDEEFGLCNWHPVVENFHCPYPRPQGQVQRGLVVGEFSSGLNQDVIGGCDDVDGIHPDDGHSHVGALPPLLHAHRLVHGPQETPKVAEEPLLGIPVSADLKQESES